MNEVYEKVMRCFEYVKDRIPFEPKVALVLGSGLGDFAETMKSKSVIPYGDIPGFPQSTVQGHKGQFVFGYVGDTPVVAMQGRVHYYEGYKISDVVLPARLMSLMGAKILFLTNAAGGLDLSFQPGDLMMITDQIASFVQSPLIGPHIEEWGLRFPPMDEIYDCRLQDVMRHVAQEEKINLQEGVYIQLTGPNYESTSEVKMCQILGGSAVGMSTAVEAIAAKNMGMRICGISCICNMACGISKTPLSHKEVGEVANRTAPVFTKLVQKSIEQFGKE